MVHQKVHQQMVHYRKTMIEALESATQTNCNDFQPVEGHSTFIWKILCLQHTAHQAGSMVCFPSSLLLLECASKTSPRFRFINFCHRSMETLLVRWLCSNRKCLVIALLLHFNFTFYNTIVLRCSIVVCCCCCCCCGRSNNIQRRSLVARAHWGQGHWPARCHATTISAWIQIGVESNESIQILYVPLFIFFAQNKPVCQTQFARSNSASTPLLPHKKLK